jgi:hypothetical protein
VDITTTGARSGLRRRIEIWFWQVGVSERSPAHQLEAATQARTLSIAVPLDLIAK